MKELKNPVFLGLGANLGNPQKTLEEAISLIQRKLKGENFKASRIYRTKPVDCIPQPDYLNSVAYFETSIPLLQLWAQLQKIEEQLGKKEKPKDHPRLIDIDLLLYGHAYSQNPNLELPHPRMLNRLFVLLPLSELTDVIEFPQKQRVIKLTVKDLIRKILSQEDQHAVPL